jgi:hypothetical protein
MLTCNPNATLAHDNDTPDGADDYQVQGVVEKYVFFRLITPGYNTYAEVRRSESEAQSATMVARAPGFYVCAPRVTYNGVPSSDASAFPAPTAQDFANPSWTSTDGIVAKVAGDETAVVPNDSHQPKPVVRGNTFECIHTGNLPRNYSSWYLITIQRGNQLVDGKAFLDTDGKIRLAPGDQLVQCAKLHTTNWLFGGPVPEGFKPFVKWKFRSGAFGWCFAQTAQALDAMQFDSSVSCLRSIDSLTLFYTGRWSSNQFRVVVPKSGTRRADRLVGTDTRDDLRGGGGNDRLFGKGDDDKLDGGEGHDRLNGGGGVDSFDGGSGNDIIYARDGSRDASIVCGKGRDVVYADKADKVHRSCEKVYRAGAR